MFTRLLSAATFSTTALLCFLTVSLPRTSYAFDYGKRQHREAVVDNKRFLFIDTWMPNPMSVHLHLKLSNGWRVDPWHVLAHVVFLSAGKEIARIDAHVWCPASLGGHAKECEYDYDMTRADFWPAADNIALSGETEAPRYRGKPPPPTVPIFRYSFP
jgi:hypothetical protein